MARLTYLPAKTIKTNQLQICIHSITITSQEHFLTHLLSHTTHIQTSRIILCETSKYREQVTWSPIIDLVDISCPWVATDARDRMNRIEYVVSLGCALVKCICKPDNVLHKHVTK